MRSRDKRDSTIHGILEPEVEEIQLEEQYDILKTLGEGHFAQVVLALHRKTDTTVVLKQIHKEITAGRDFSREYHYNYHLSPHPSIISSYNVSFVANNSYTYAMEYAPCGDLSGHVKANGLPEDLCKKVIRQVTSALEFMHYKQLVHRDIKLENILVFDPVMEKVKVCDFGCTRRDGSLVSRVKCTWASFLPPEICEVLDNEKYHCHPGNDVWQLGVVIFVCLTGCTPWQKADEILDVQYKSFSRWKSRKAIKMPTNFKKFSVRMLRLLRRLFESTPEKRPPVTETEKYMKDSWLVSQIQTSKSAPTIAQRTESFSKEDGRVVSLARVRSKRQPPVLATDCKVDQHAVTKRVWDWISSCENYEDNCVEGI